MSITIKKEFTSRLLDRLFSYYIDSKLSAKDPLDMVSDQARTFVKKMSKQEKQEFIHNTPDLYLDLIEVPKGSALSRVELFDGFERLRQAIYEVLTKQSTEVEDMQPVIRKTIPALKAFEHIGNNDLKISYGLSNLALH